MNELKRIHPDYQIYFRTYGNSVQTRITQLSFGQFTSEDKFALVEPGRTILIGDLENELRKMLTEIGKPSMNKLTATDSRKGGVFSTRAFDSLRRHLFGDTWKTTSPRARPSLRAEKVTSPGQ